MNGSEETQRIKKEYERRAREISDDYYSLEKPWNAFRYQSFCHELLTLLKTSGIYPLADKKILEIGCGSGNWLTDFEKWGASRKNLYGIDLDETRLLKAKLSFPDADLRTGDAGCLPWADESFDLIFQFTVFSSVLSNELKEKISQEMIRVLKPQGIIVWYDFFVNNPWNPNVKGVSGAEIRKLFPLGDISMKKVTLAPPITRVLRGSLKFCSFLEKAVFLNTHLLATIRTSK